MKVKDLDSVEINALHRHMEKNYNIDSSEYIAFKKLYGYWVRASKELLEYEQYFENRDKEIPVEQSWSFTHDERQEEFE